MIRDLRIAVIGAGVMGEAMIGGLLKQQLVAPEQVVATEPRGERRAHAGVVEGADNRRAAVARFGDERDHRLGETAAGRR